MTIYCRNILEIMKHTEAGREFTNIVLKVFKLHGLLLAEGDRLTEEFNLSSARWKVLGALAMASRPITVPRIANSMGLSRQAAQRLVNEMKKSGFILSETNPQHKRAPLYALTQKGEETFKLLEKKQIAWANRVAAGLNIKDLKSTTSVLQELSLRLES